MKDEEGNRLYSPFWISYSSEEAIEAFNQVCRRCHDDEPAVGYSGFGGTDSPLPADRLALVLIWVLIRRSN
ncbi:hypothetical protein ACFLZ5_04000 [Thermodesulfobacteriota bacterium]